MQPYAFILHGYRSAGSGLPGALVRDLLDAVDDGARGAVRLRFEGRSRAKGGYAPGWITEASAFEFVGLLPRGGLEFRAPTFAESLPDRFAQCDLFRVVSPHDTPLSLFGASLAEAVRGEADSEAYDEPLLTTFEEFRRVFRHGVEAVEMLNGRSDSAPLVVTPEGVQTVHRLKRQTPPPRRVRIAGKVDEIRHSDRAFTLLLQTGEALRGVLAEGDPETLASHFGRPAVVSGMALFRPSGTLLRLEADRLDTADQVDLALWSAPPQPLSSGFADRDLRRPQGSRSGLNAIVGKWPGDETDDEIFSMLEEIS